MFDRDSLRTKSAVLINDSFQNRKQYNIPKAQLVIADIPYNLGVNAYASSPQWYIGGDIKTPKIHPTQKSLYLLKMLISLFTDKDDVVIDPCAGSGSTLLACEELGRKSYGFEIKKEFVKNFNEVLMKNVEKELF